MIKSKATSGGDTAIRLWALTPDKILKNEKVDIYTLPLTVSSNSFVSQVIISFIDLLN